MPAAPRVREDGAAAGVGAREAVEPGQEAGRGQREARAQPARRNSRRDRGRRNDKSATRMYSSPPREEPPP